MADKAAKLAKAAVSAARKATPQRVYFPNRIVQFMNTQEKKVTLPGVLGVRSRDRARDAQTHPRGYCVLPRCRASFVSSQRMLSAPQRLSFCAGPDAHRVRCAQEELDVVKFRVSPKMNKLEMKEWIESAYDTPVKKVNTANYEGKIVRRSGGKGTKFCVRHRMGNSRSACMRACVRACVRAHWPDAQTFLCSRQLRALGN